MGSFGEPKNIQHTGRFLCVMFLFVSVFVSPLVSQNNVSATSIVSTLASFPSCISGEYVVYRDYSWKEPTWIGFLYYDDSTWGAFAFTPSTSSRVSVLFRTEESEGSLVLTGQQVISKITPADVPTVNYLMSLLPDLYSWRNELSFPFSEVRLDTQGRSSILPKGLALFKTLPHFGGVVSIRFAPEVPVFNMVAMTGAGKKNVLELARSGRVGSSGDSAFFSFEPQGEIKTSSVFSSSSKLITETRLVDGVELHLDNQWTMLADNTFFLGNTAVIIVDTLDLCLMEIPVENLALSFVRMFSFSSPGAWADPSKLRVTGTKECIRIENLFFDVQSETLNRDIKKCIISPDGKKCTVISLSVSDASWENNAAYFNALF